MAHEDVRTDVHVVAKIRHATFEYCTILYFTGNYALVFLFLVLRLVLY